MAGEPAPRLDGWKAIAGYLGRDVRTVQRWRDERGMPVYRIPGGKSGSVFAHLAELDAWLLQRSRTTRASKATTAGPVSIDPVAPTAFVSAVTASGAADRRTGMRNRRVAIAIALAVAGLVGVAVIRIATPGTATPARVEIVGGRFVARADDDSTLWTVPLIEQPGHAVDGAIVDKVSLMDTIRAAFRPGDADVVALVSVSRVATAPLAPSLLRNDVYSLSPAGRLRWMFSPRNRLTFGGREFAGPWRIYAWTALPGPKPTVWVSFIDHVWWPSQVVRLDGDGHADTAFVNSGHIAALAPMQIGRGTYVLAGGVNNEYRSAALALLDPAAEPSTSPQHAGTAFACDDCPRGSPRQYFLFPPLEVDAASNVPFELVDSISAAPHTPLEVSVRDSSALNIRAVYRFSDALVPESVAMSERYWEVHRDLFRRGTLDHPPERCPERTRGVTIRTWQADTGWTEVAVRPTFAARETR